MSPPEPTGEEQLRAIQAELMAAIAFSEQPPSIEGLIQNRKGFDAEAQLGIYAQAATASWVNALRQTYPSARRWIGEDAFDALARRYLATRPSRAGDLERLGEDFAAFVAASAELDTSELAELCRFECLINQLRLAPDVEAFGGTALASIDIDALVDSGLRLIPRAALFESEYPVVRRWQGEEEETRLAESVLLVFEDSLRMRPVSATQATFIRTVTLSPTFGSAIETALQQHPNEDISTLIAFAVESGAFVAVLNQRTSCSSRWQE